MALMSAHTLTGARRSAARMIGMSIHGRRRRGDVAITPAASAPAASAAAASAAAAGPVAARVARSASIREHGPREDCGLHKHDAQTF